MSDTVKVTFLGTGTSQGVPVIACPCSVCASPDPLDKRLRSSVCIETDGKTIVIDTGPDFRQQMLRAGIQHLDAVFFTHNHKDHTAGLDDIRAFNYLQKSPMDVYAEAYVQDSLRQEYAYIFATNPYPGSPSVRLHTITEEPFDVHGTPVIPIRAMHYKLPILGFRIHRFAYITDANFIDDREAAKLKGVTHLVVNALRHEQHMSHFCLEEAVAFIRKTGVPHGYLTHIGHQMGFQKDVQAELPGHIKLAYDQLQIVVP